MGQPQHRTTLRCGQQQLTTSHPCAFRTSAGHRNSKGSVASPPPRFVAAACQFLAWSRDTDAHTERLGDGRRARLPRAFCAFQISRLWFGSLGGARRGDVAQRASGSDHERLDVDDAPSGPSEPRARSLWRSILDGVEVLPVVVEEHQRDPIVGECRDSHRRVVCGVSASSAPREASRSVTAREPARDAAALVDHVGKVGSARAASETARRMSPKRSTLGGGSCRATGEGESDVVLGWSSAHPLTLASTSIRSLSGDEFGLGPTCVDVCTDSKLASISFMPSRVP